jgi:hypothetical protein
MFWEFLATVPAYFRHSQKMPLFMRPFFHVGHSEFQPIEHSVYYRMRSYNYMQKQQDRMTYAGVMPDLLEGKCQSK